MVVISVGFSSVNLRNLPGRASVSHVLPIAGQVPTVAHHELEESVRVNRGRHETVILHELFGGHLIATRVRRLMVLFKSLLEFHLDLVFSSFARLDIRVAGSFESLLNIFELKHA